MPYEPGTDPRALRSGAYANSRGLDDRRAIYEYATSRADFVDWTCDCVEWPASGRVLDVGCGPGRYVAHLADMLPGIQLMAFDASLGMATDAAAAAPDAMAGVADASLLPFVDHSVDVVLAAHMLYHVPGPEAAVAEFRRVLVPSGTLVAVTNGREHLAQLRALVTDAVGGEGWLPVSDRWDIETGERMLRDVFDRVETHRFGQQLEVPESGPVLRYLASLEDMADPRLTRGGAWQDVLEQARRAVDAEIADKGAFTITGSSGALVAR